MEKKKQICEAIRELILLGFFTRNNFAIHQIFLGEYQYNGKKYEMHSSWSEGQTSIFIKCEDNSIHLIVEDDERSRRFNGPVTNDVYLHINNYRNIDFWDVVYLSDLEKINKENIIYESKFKVYYGLSYYMYINPNGLGIGPCGFKGKRFIFTHSESFDKKIENEKGIEIFNGLFSSEIILNLIEQVYPNFEYIYTSNKIDGIIRSLSQEELLILKEKLQEYEKTDKKLVRTKSDV